MPDLTHSYFAELAKAIESIARPAGYEVLICSTDESPEKEAAEIAALGNRTDGLIIASSIAQDKAGVYRKLINYGAKLVFLDRHFERVPSRAVVTDNVLVGLLATEHLINLGYRRVGHLRGTEVRVATDRLHGYRQALRNHEISFDEKLVRPCGFFERNGYDAMCLWIAEGDLPRAIFAVNDPAAIGAMSALHNAGIGVPDEVAVVGAGAIHYGDLLRVPLTTVGWDLTEMGQQAARLLIETIRGNPGKDNKRRNVVVEPKLVVRDSCGASINGRTNDKVATRQNRR